jgi:hypothetical protein
LQNGGGISAGNYFSMDKFVDRVHVSVDRLGVLDPPWTDGGADRGGRGTAARTRERRPTREGMNQKGNRTSANAPSTRGLAGPAGLDSACERREASGSRLGRKVSRAENKEKEFLN